MILQLSQLVSNSSGDPHLLVCVPTKSEQCCASLLSLSIPISLLATPKYRYLPWATSFVRRPLFLHFFCFCLGDDAVAESPSKFLRPLARSQSCFLGL